MEHRKHPVRRCAVYSRKSSEEGLEQDFNSLHAQRDACEAFIRSQAGEGWRLNKTHYDDGGISGGTMERPALQRLLQDIRNGLVDVVVVYKVDRLTRSLADFAKMVEVFDASGLQNQRPRPRTFGSLRAPRRRSRDLARCGRRAKITGSEFTCGEHRIISCDINCFALMSLSPRTRPAFPFSRAAARGRPGRRTADSRADQ